MLHQISVKNKRQNRLINNYFGAGFRLRSHQTPAVTHSKAWLISLSLRSTLPFDTAIGRTSDNVRAVACYPTPSLAQSRHTHWCIYLNGSGRDRDYDYTRRNVIIRNVMAPNTIWESAPLSFFSLTRRTIMIRFGMSYPGQRLTYVLV